MVWFGFSLGVVIVFSVVVGASSPPVDNNNNNSNNSPAPNRSWYFSGYASSVLARPSIITPTRLTFLPLSIDAFSASPVPAAAVGQGKAADEWKASRVARTLTGTPVATDSSWSSLMAAASSSVD